MFGLSSLASCQKPHTTNIEPYYGHDYTYRKGDPCPHGIENKKNGESNHADGEYRGWYDRSNQQAGRIAVGHREIPAGRLYKRGHRTYLIERGGYPLGQGEGGE